MIKSVIFAMAEEIEKRIRAEMNEAGTGSLMQDAWTKLIIHYIVLDEVAPF